MTNTFNILIMLFILYYTYIIIKKNTQADYVINVMYIFVIV